jgi:hypothetical protein
MPLAIALNVTFATLFVGTWAYLVRWVYRSAAVPVPAGR